MNDDVFQVLYGKTVTVEELSGRVLGGRVVSFSLNGSSARLVIQTMGRKILITDEQGLIKSMSRQRRLRAE